MCLAMCITLANLVARARQILHSDLVLKLKVRWRTYHDVTLIRMSICIFVQKNCYQSRISTIRSKILFVLFEFKENCGLKSFVKRTLFDPTQRSLYQYLYLDHTYITRKSIKSSQSYVRLICCANNIFFNSLHNNASEQRDIIYY